MSFSVFARETGERREIEQRKVIVVGGITLTSGPAWANRCAACVCVLRVCVLRVCVCVSKYSRLVRLWSALTCITFLSPSTVFLTIFLLNLSLPHSAPRSHLSSSSSHSVHSALQINPPTLTHAHTAKGIYCQDQQVVLLCLYSCCTCYFIYCLFLFHMQMCVHSL